MRKGAFMLSSKFTYIQDFRIENGQHLSGITMSYAAYGQLNQNRDNVIYVCHALTADAHVKEWWPEMVGDGLIFDTTKYFIVCANILGSCYGSTGPTETNPHSNQKYGSSFPPITIRDIVKGHQLLAKHLQISSIQLICGGSLGGQQAMEWAISEPDFIGGLFIIATNARHSAWGIAFNEAQRMAINAGENGLEAARAVAMLSYRNYNMYVDMQTDSDERTDNFSAASYQRYQGEKLKKRFDADSYAVLSKAMDSHNVGRGRKSIADALACIKAKTLVTGITSDLLFPTTEQRYLAEHIPNAMYTEVDSQYGHDGFLIETKQISELLRLHLGV
jgi:homoserine O-acetyltransferase